MRKLVTLLPSVDVDMGRWLMHLWQMAYEERPHAPIFHILALKRHGLGPEEYPALFETGSKTAVATIEKLVLTYDHQGAYRVMPDLETEKALYDEVNTLQHEARYTMGSAVVNWAYFELMKEKRLVWRSFTAGVPWYEHLFLTFGFPIIRNLMIKGLGLGEEVAANSLKTIHAEFDKIDALLADGRRYLAGDRLTAADLAVATSGAPMVLADGYGGHLPSFDMLPANLARIIQSFRDRPTGQFIQRIYDDHRKAG